MRRGHAGSGGGEGGVGGGEGGWDGVREVGRVRGCVGRKEEEWNECSGCEGVWYWVGCWSTFIVFACFVFSFFFIFFFLLVF